MAKTQQALSDWYTYERLSPKVNGDYEPGMLRQAEDNAETVRRQGGTVVYRFIDEDRSAYSTRQREGFQELMAGIRAGTIKRFAVQHADRLYRKPKELEDLIELAISGGVVFATPDKLYNLANADDRFAARILVAVAAKSSDDQSRRQTRMHKGKADAGLPVGTRPFGYQADKVTPDPVEAPLYQDAAARVLDGMSLRSIVLDWDAQGIRSAVGHRWNHRGLKRVLISPRYAGLRVHQDQVVGKAVWPGLISEADHLRLVALLTHPDRQNISVRKWKYLLTGRVFCGRPECQKPLSGRPNNSKRGYCCQVTFGGCGKLTRDAERVENEVVERYLARIATLAPTQAAEPVRASVLELSAEVKAIDAKLGSLLLRWEADKLTEAEWDAASARLRIRRQALTTELAGQQPVTPALAAAPTDRAGWDSLDRDIVRQHLFAMVERVIIHPAKKGPGFDPSKVEVIWKVNPS